VGFSSDGELLVIASVADEGERSVENNVYGSITLIMPKELKTENFIHYSQTFFRTSQNVV